MQKQILIVYQYPEFINKVLHELFPDKFSKNYFTDAPKNLLISIGNDSYSIFTQSGLNDTSYTSIPEIYIEGSLMKGELPQKYAHAYVVNKEDLIV